ncbi:MAG: potassium-transporting ATPase subunit F [Pseudoclavibacter sp.]
MMVFEFIAFGLGIAAIAYFVVALVKPERF